MQSSASWLVAGTRAGLQDGVAHVMYLVPVKIRREDSVGNSVILAATTLQIYYRPCGKL
jgi:hypothetical protein